MVASLAVAVRVVQRLRHKPPGRGVVDDAGRIRYLQRLLHVCVAGHLRANRLTWKLAFLDHIRERLFEKKISNYKAAESKV